jgi:hypothetical protein
MALHAAAMATATMIVRAQRRADPRLSGAERPASRALILCNLEQPPPNSVLNRRRWGQRGVALRSP